MKLSILVAFILAFGLSVSAANAADFEGLVGYWPLDGDVMDASGNGHDGILTSDGNPDWVDGRLDNALSFRNASIACGDFNPSEETDELTVALWVYWDGDNHFGHMVGKGEDWTNMMWYIFMQEDHPTIHANADPGRLIFDGPVVPIETWTHIAITVDASASEATLYMDGDNVSTGAYNFADSGPDTTVGIGHTFAGTATFLGEMDEVLIFSRVLSAAEIQMLADGLKVLNVLAVDPAAKLTITWGKIKR